MIISFFNKAVNRKDFTMSKLARMRTLDECFAEIKAMDENTAISKYYIRQLALSGKIPVVMCGRKRLINLGGLIDYLSNPYNAAAQSASGTYGNIRRIS